MGLGEAKGTNKAKLAAEQAIGSPLLDLSIEGAKGLIFNITAGEDVLLSEITEASKIITAKVDRNANIIYGHNVDESMKDEIKITVIATGVSSLPKIAHIPQVMYGVDGEELRGLNIPAFLRQRPGFLEE